MSTILDALRRLQRDRERAAPVDLQESVAGELYVTAAPRRRLSWVLAAATALAVGVVSTLLLVLGGESWDEPLPLPLAESPPPRSVPPTREPASSTRPAEALADATPGRSLTQAASTPQPGRARLGPASAPGEASSVPPPLEAASLTVPNRAVGAPRPRFGKIQRGEPGAPPVQRESRAATALVVAAHSSEAGGARAPAPAVPQVVPHGPPRRVDGGEQQTAPAAKPRVSEAARTRTLTSAVAPPSKPPKARAAQILAQAEPTKKTTIQTPSTAAPPPPAQTLPSAPPPPTGDDSLPEPAPETGPDPAVNPFLEPFEPMTAVERLVREKIGPTLEREAEIEVGLSQPAEPAGPPPGPRFPDLALTSVRWHPDPARRMAQITIESVRGVEVHQGDVIQGATIHRIDPGAIEMQLGSARKLLRIRP